MRQIIDKRKYTYVFSITLSILSMVTLFVWGLNFGIDFLGGTRMEVQFGVEDGGVVPTAQQVREKLSDMEIKSLSVQPSENNVIALRYIASDEDLNERVVEKLRDFDKNAKQIKVDFVGASVSEQLKDSAIIALILAVLGIAAYIAWSFRKVSYPISSWKYGLAAVVALTHDILITIGAFSFLGKFYGAEVDIAFVAALLTILGYSVNDTIVVFDRTRENILRTGGKEDFEKTVNRSLNETLARSINTSLTVMIVLAAIVIWGGASIKYFATTLLIGVTFGTYSSIFVASAMLVTIYKYQIKK